MASNKNILAPGDNVFAALELPNADELHVKAQLANEIHRAITESGLTQVQAARLMGTTQAKVSDVVRCKLDGFSIDRLFRFLTGLGKDVEIAVVPRPPSVRDGSPWQVRRPGRRILPAPTASSLHTAGAHGIVMDR